MTDIRSMLPLRKFKQFAALEVGDRVRGPGFSPWTVIEKQDAAYLIRNERGAERLMSLMVGGDREVELWGE